MPRVLEPQPNCLDCKITIRRGAKRCKKCSRAKRLRDENERRALIRALPLRPCRRCSLPFKPTGTTEVNCLPCRLKRKPPAGEEIKITCTECNEVFLWIRSTTAGGLPRRCDLCRSKRRNNVASAWKQLSPDQQDRLLQEKRKHRLKSRFGLSPEQYEQLGHIQDDVCAICGGPPAFDRILAVDHDHVSGHVRGLLCGGCNTAIGLFQDNIAILISAINYLTYTPMDSLQGKDPFLARIPLRSSDYPTASGYASRKWTPSMVDLDKIDYSTAQQLYPGLLMMR